MLTGLSTAAKALGFARHHEKSIEVSFGILVQFGESLVRATGDEELKNGIKKMSHILQATSDDGICNMKECSDKKMITLINVYLGLAHVLHYRQPWQVGSVSVRMVELTLKNGLSAKSPLAFAHFGGVLVSEGRIHEGCRLGESNDFFSNSLLLILHVYILSTFNRHRKAGTQTG